MSYFPSFFLDPRLYLFGLLLVFSPLLSSFSWLSMRNSSYADWVKWGNEEVSKIMDFRIKIFFLSFFISNKVILERGLNPLIIPIHASLISLDNLGGVIWSSEVTPIFNIRGIPVALLSFQFQYFHSSRM
jgi:hypothetical protein